MIQNKLLTPLFFLFAFLLNTESFSQTQSGQKDLFSPQNRLKFGNYLFCDEDYLRAVHEYQEYLQFYCDDTVRFKIAAGFQKMNRLTEAADNFKGLFFNSTLSEEARLEFYKSNFLMSDFEKFRSLCEMKNYFPTKYEQEIKRLKNISYLIEGNKLPDSLNFVSPFEEEDQVKLMNFYKRRKYPEYKNPTTAAFLSALLPGLGKIYTEKYTDGITAFLFTGVLAFLAYDNFKAKHEVRAWIFTGLAALFYGGNIYGSAASAQIYNAGVSFNFDSELNLYLNQQNFFLPQHDFLCN